MTTPRDGVLLRVYVGESDTYEGHSLHVTIVEEARRLRLAGATVLRGMMGYGAASRVHAARFLRVSEDLPLVIEIVDTEDRVALLLPFLERVMPEGLVTTETVRIHSPRSARSDS